MMKITHQWLKSHNADETMLEFVKKENLIGLESEHYVKRLIELNKNIYADWTVRRILFDSPLLWIWNKYASAAQSASDTAIKEYNAVYTNRKAHYCGPDADRLAHYDADSAYSTEYYGIIARKGLEILKEN